MLAHFPAQKALDAGVYTEPHDLLFLISVEKSSSRLSRRGDWGNQEKVKDSLHVAVTFSVTYLVTLVYYTSACLCGRDWCDFNATGTVFGNIKTLRSVNCAVGASLRKQQPCGFCVLLSLPCCHTCYWIWLMLMESRALRNWEKNSDS